MAFSEHEVALKVLQKTKVAFCNLASEKKNLLCIWFLIHTGKGFVMFTWCFNGDAIKCFTGEVESTGAC